MNEKEYSYYQDPIFRIRDLEEKQRLLRERVILISKTVIDLKEKSFNEIQEIKKIILKINEEISQIKRLMEKISEQADNSARKEDLMIIQRQLDILRER